MGASYGPEVREHLSDAACSHEGVEDCQLVYREEQLGLVGLWVVVAAVAVAVVVATATAAASAVVAVV